MAFCSVSQAGPSAPQFAQTTKCESMPLLLGLCARLPQNGQAAAGQSADTPRGCGSPGARTMPGLSFKQNSSQNAGCMRRSPASHCCQVRTVVCTIAPAAVCDKPATSRASRIAAGAGGGGSSGPRAWLAMELRANEVVRFFDGGRVGVRDAQRGQCSPIFECVQDALQVHGRGIGFDGFNEFECSHANHLPLYPEARLAVRAWPLLYAHCAHNKALRGIQLYLARILSYLRKYREHPFHTQDHPPRAHHGGSQ